MENFNAKEYRDNLAKDLKDTRKTDPEKAQEILSEAQQTEEYQKAKMTHLENKLIKDSMKKELFDLKGITVEVGEIALSKYEISNQTKIYAGPLDEGVFKKMPESIEHIYTEFPEKELLIQHVMIGGKTRNELLQQLKDSNSIEDHGVGHFLEDGRVTLSKEQKPITLVGVFGKDVGFPLLQRYGYSEQNREIGNLYDKANFLGLELCPTETIFHIKQIQDIKSFYREDHGGSPNEMQVFVSSPIPTKEKARYGGTTDVIFAIREFPSSITPRIETTYASDNEQASFSAKTMYMFCLPKSLEKEKVDFTQKEDLSMSENQTLEASGSELVLENRKIDQVEYNNLLQKEVGEEKVLEKIKETKIDFYDNNKNFVDSLKEALENIDFKGLENIALVNIDGIGVDKTESLVRKDSNKEFIIYSFQSEDKLKSDNPKVALLLAKDNVKFLRLPFTPDDLIRTINSEVIETKDSKQNLQEIQDKEILNKTSYLLHKIHISSIEQFDTLPENEARNLPSLISEAKEYFPALENKTDREIVEFLLQIRQNVPEVMKGQNIEGVYCDIEGTLFNGEELNQNTLNTLKDLESQGKNITLWTDGDTNQLQKLLDKNGITYPLKSKIDHAGASAEIVIDNDDQNTFSAKTKIFAKKFINL